MKAAAPALSRGASGMPSRTKGSIFEVRPVRFADVGTIRALSGQHLTPVLSHGDHVVHETWDIACYLEEQFPDRPSLFGGAIGRGMARHINAWSDAQLASPLRLVIYDDFPAVLDAGDRDYFRSTRERTLGVLEAARADPSGDYDVSTSLHATRTHALRTALHLRFSTSLRRLLCVFRVPVGAARKSKGGCCSRFRYC